MKVKYIYTKRAKSGQNYAQPIIYEWEDVIAKKFNIPIIRRPRFYKIFKHIGIHQSIVSLFSNTFRFVVNARDCDKPMNSKNIIPCIIDFFEDENQLEEFYSKHSKNKVVLVSSPYDYQYLKKHNCPINVKLLAYSLSDQYKLSINSKIEKKYDIVLTGRQDPLLYSFFMEYVLKHPNVSYVKRGKELDNDLKKSEEYYINGEVCLGKIETREEFMQLQSQGKVTLYGVQGYYEGFTKGFYHMTPHFLEIIACANHVLAHYPNGEDGIDAQYYEFDKFSPSIETYEAFEAAMDYALTHEVDVKMYEDYLKKHYTSVRAKQLKELLATL